MFYHATSFSVTLHYVMSHHVLPTLHHVLWRYTILCYSTFTFCHATSWSVTLRNVLSHCTMFCHTIPCSVTSHSYRKNLKCLYAHFWNPYPGYLAYISECLTFKTDILTLHSTHILYAPVLNDVAAASVQCPGTANQDGLCSRCVADVEAQHRVRLGVG